MPNSACIGSPAEGLLEREGDGFVTVEQQREDLAWERSHDRRRRRLVGTEGRWVMESETRSK